MINYRGILFTIGITFFLTKTFCFGETGRVPKNLRQAIFFLSSDCPDSLKCIIKETADHHLKKLTYPWGGDYKTIDNWISSDNENLKISRYLSNKNIKYHKTEIVLIAFKRSLLGQPFDEKSILAPFLAVEAKWMLEDKVRYTADSLRGNYIPKDIGDCIRQISSFWSDSVQLKMKSLNEEEFVGRLHLGFGTALRNNWQLWAGSRLSHYFDDKGVDHPEGMSSIILTSYHRYLNGKDIRFEEQIEEYRDFMTKSKLAEKERKDKEFSVYKLGDTLFYNYSSGYVSKQQEKRYEDNICDAKGVITEIDNKQFLIKVRLIESCDKKGIIVYDNENSLIYDQRTQRFEKPKRRKIIRLKVKQEYWFRGDEWGK